MRFFSWGLVLVGLMGTVSPVVAQLDTSPPVAWSEPAPPASSPDSTASRSLQRRASANAPALSHVVGRNGVFLYNRPDSTAPVAKLSARTPLYRLGCDDHWCRVRTEEGDTGHVPASTISNVWLRVEKADRRLYFYRGTRLVETFKIDVGYNAFADKKQQGSRRQRDHWRTPEGTFYVVHKNPRSSFYKALVLNYPTVQDAKRGLKEGLISQHQYEAIVNAQEAFRMPPMNTQLGGWIEIHGQGTGGATNWTQGCVAVENRVMNQLWTEVEVGTPVLIE